MKILKKMFTLYEIDFIKDIYRCCYREFKKKGLIWASKYLGYNIQDINKQKILKFFEYEYQLKLEEYNKQIDKTFFEVEPNGSIWKYIVLKP